MASSASPVGTTVGDGRYLRVGNGVCLKNFSTEQTRLRTESCRRDWSFEYGKFDDPKVNQRIAHSSLSKPYFPPACDLDGGGKVVLEAAFGRNDLDYYWNHPTVGFAQREAFMRFDRMKREFPSIEAPGWYIDRQEVCPQLSAHSSCGSPLDKSDRTRWLRLLCAGVSNFTALPEGWEAEERKGEFDPVRDTTSEQVGSRPDCISPSCNNKMIKRVADISQWYCLPDGATGRCSPQSAFALSDFCSGVSFGSTCTGECTSVLGRRDWLSYLNSTCASDASWDGLPANWTDLLHAQLSEIRPWESILPAPGGFDMAGCPKPSENLAVFAAANAAVLLLTPLLGRRTIVSKLSGGYLGMPHSRSWLYMGPLVASIQVLVTTANALITKRTPGYEDVSLIQLVLVWLSRPRLAWLALVLAPFQSTEAMYLSSASSAVAAEAILQVLSAVTMGYVATHGRNNGFYSAGTPIPQEFRNRTLTMYAGAMMSLVVFIGALVAMAIFLFGLDRMLETTGRRMLRARRLRKLQHEAALLEQSLIADAGVLREFETAITRKLDHVTGQQPKSHALSIRLYMATLNKYYTATTPLVSELPDSLVTAIQECDDLQSLYAAACEEVKLIESTRPPLDLNRQRPQLATWEEQGRKQAALDLAKKAEITRREELSRHAISKSFQHAKPTAERLKAASRKVSFGDYQARRALEALVHERKHGDKSRRSDNPPSPEFDFQPTDLSSLQTCSNAAVASSRQAARLSDRQLSILESQKAQVERELGRRGDMVIEVFMAFALCAMTGCFIAQWLFWAGFVHLYSPDQYCPPKLATLAINWVIFSVLGVPLGASA
ncbi:hypothetical protein QBC34DRAFT_467864 [Podospora aff. communis PSN243]|uniref:Uncharacterized protein n=1 Tax=Podospora aff. communis PSN243 TaxID=3040156 RepID=A0AAV9GGT2_9PEZI|nr:hypothetical protein QBC34DRAFT_467864 [Podospora aff. communis PSN243]